MIEILFLDISLLNSLSNNSHQRIDSQFVASIFSIRLNKDNQKLLQEGQEIQAYKNKPMKR